jgi:hypothetical protein
MPRVHQIEVREGKSLEETADWLAMSASAVLHELFPDQWQQAMTLMVQRINERVAAGILESATRTRSRGLIDH